MIPQRSGERVGNASTDFLSFARHLRIDPIPTYSDAKAMAMSLREALEQREVKRSHSDCLELVATQFGLKDWNVLSARIDADTSAPATIADPAQFKRAIPILRIFSVEKAKEFYVDFLGFKIEWEHRFHDNMPLYCEISRAGMKLHLSEHHGDASPRSTVFVWMRGIADYHKELLGKKYRYNRPGLEDAPWDAKVMEVNDPFGNKLRFGEPNKADDPRA